MLFLGILCGIVYKFRVVKTELIPSRNHAYLWQLTKILGEGEIKKQKASYRGLGIVYSPVNNLRTPVKII